MEQEVYYQEVEVKRPKQVGYWVFTIISIVCAAIGIAVVNDRADYFESRWHHSERYKVYLQRYNDLDKERGQFMEQWYKKCFRLPNYPERVCTDLDYKIDRYNREVKKINKIYDDGGWVDDPNRKNELADRFNREWEAVRKGEDIVYYPKRKY